MAERPQRASNRIVGVEAWRLVAIVAVVAIHATPTAVAGIGRWLDPSYLVNQVARFAVPFFFVVSGYFWGARLGRPDDAVAAALPTMRRLLWLFVVWSIVYALPYDVTQFSRADPLGPLRAAWWHLHGAAAHPLTVAMQGTKSHLWFLVALVFAMAITATCVRRRRPGLLIALSLSLYAVELLTKPYAGSAWGWTIDFNTRNGPFVGTLFFAIGYALSRVRPSRWWLPVGCVSFAVGVVAQCAENWFVVTRRGADGLQDFVVGTVPLGVGAALIALSGRSLARADGLARLGRDALAIYLLHIVFVDWFVAVANAPAPPIVDHVAAIALVLACTWLAVRLLSQTRAGRALLTGPTASAAVPAVGS